MEHLLSVRVVLVALLLLTLGVGATTYLGTQAKQEDALAQARVKTAALAAEAWFQDPFGGHGSYERLSGKALVHEAPVVSSNVQAFSLAGGRAYCLADVEASGHSAYYLGGDTAVLAKLHGLVPLQVTLVHSTGRDAASICASIS